ncbi:MAG: DUF1636 family protein [Pseudomonadota bacterium]
MRPRVIICSTCAAPGADPQGAGFADALQGLVPKGVVVETTECMNLCNAPMSMALRGEGRDVYLFSGVDPETDLDNAAALARIYSEAEGGTITDARPAGRLRHCLVGRVPK